MKTLHTKVSKTKNTKTTKNTLKNKITKYFCETKEQDICCESDHNREKIVSEILALYKTRYVGYANEYLEWIDNDIVIFIGYRVNLEKDKNIKGVKLWDLIASKNKQHLSETNIKGLLMELPLYFLLAFLGNSYIKLKN